MEEQRLVQAVAAFLGSAIELTQHTHAQTNAQTHAQTHAPKMVSAGVNPPFILAVLVLAVTVATTQSRRSSHNGRTRACSTKRSASATIA